MRHGVARVDREIHDDLLDLAGVNPHHGGLPARQNHQLDVFANEMLQHLAGIAHQRVQRK